MKGLLLTTLLLALAVLPTSAIAGSDSGGRDQRDLEAEVVELKATVAELESALRALGAEVARNRRTASLDPLDPDFDRSLDAWASALAGTRHALATPGDLLAGPVRAYGGPRSVLMQTGEPDGLAPDQEPIRIVLDQTLISEGGLLLPPGTLEVEPSIDYALFDTRRISVSGFSILPTLIIGVLETEKIQTNFLDSILSLRLGLPHDFQVDARVPYRYAHQRRSTEVSDETESDTGIGDVELALSYQPVKERGWIPDIILGARGRFPTGEDIFDRRPGENALPLGAGFYSAQASVTAVKSFDPGVLFAGLRYEHPFDRSVKLFSTDPAETDIDPGGQIGYNIGLALSISPELAFSFRADHRFVQKTYFDGPGTDFQRREVPGSFLNVAQAFFGITWALQRNVIDFSVGIGLTEDAPDVEIRLALPFRFDLF